MIAIRILPLTRMHGLIDQTMEVFDSVVERIENKDFEIASRPDRLCRNCDLKAYCDAM